MFKSDSFCLPLAVGQTPFCSVVSKLRAANPVYIRINVNLYCVFTFTSAKPLFHLQNMDDVLKKNSLDDKITCQEY